MLPRNRSGSILKHLVKLLVAKGFSVNRTDGAPECLLVTGGRFLPGMQFDLSSCVSCYGWNRPPQTQGCLKEHRFVLWQFSRSTVSRPGAVCLLRGPRGECISCNFQKPPEPLGKLPFLTSLSLLLLSPIYFRGQIPLCCPLPRSRVIAVRVHPGSSNHPQFLITSAESSVAIQGNTDRFSRLELWMPWGTGIQPSALCAALVAGDIRIHPAGSPGLNMFLHWDPQRAYLYSVTSTVTRMALGLLNTPHSAKHLHVC